jgi:hypothetical protein
MHWIKRNWTHSSLLWAAYALAAVLISVQKYAQTMGLNPPNPTRYENFRIFKNAFRHLLADTSLYIPYPAEQWDLFKYSPTFALGMAPFHWLSDLEGLTLWNLLNALLPLYALFLLPFGNPRDRATVAWFILPELCISLQNSQSNGLTLGLLLLAFAGGEGNRPLWFGFGIAGAAFIKIFGGLAAVFALIYPHPIKWVRSSLGWSLLMLALPLLLIRAYQLVRQYKEWLTLLQTDHAASSGLSVQGWLQVWFGYTPAKGSILVFGLFILLVGVWAVYRSNTRASRWQLWGAFLMWVVIFNHKAESPTYVLALCGAGIWYTTRKKHRMAESILLLLVFIFASLTPTDLFPASIRRQWVEPYLLKALPCIVLWGVIMWGLILPAFKKTTQDPKS